jgi:tetratricopeptide (TPR) repeat protein
MALGAIYYNIGQYEWALKEFRHAVNKRYIKEAFVGGDVQLELRRSKALAFCYMGLIHEIQSNSDKAVISFIKANEVYPELSRYLESGIKISSDEHKRNIYIKFLKGLQEIGSDIE